MPLSELPHEILEAIAGFCGQADVISLAVACPSIAGAVLPGIYRCIVIDAAPRPLDAARPVRCVGGRAEPCTVVRTIAGIKQCLEALAARPRFAADVRSFVCRGNVALSDNVFLPLVKTALGNLVHLRELAWSACPELPPSLLAQLVPPPPPTQSNSVPAPPTTGSATGSTTGSASPSASAIAPCLEVLSVDLAIRPGEVYPALAFPGLRALRVRPFLNASVLAWLSGLVESSRELEDVELGRFLDSKAEVGSSYRFVGLSDVHSRFEAVSAISGFFGRVARAPRAPRDRWQLRRLAVSQTDTTALDAAHLARTADLGRLQELVLTGSGREDEAGHRFLAHLAAARPQLRRLALDWRTSHASLARFLAASSMRLEALSLHVRERRRLAVELVAQTCGATLRQLAVSMDAPFALSDLEPLEQLRTLEVLKMPFSPSVNSWELAARLPCLKVLELCLCTASSPAAAAPRALSSSRAPNLGLLTSGILDAWNDSLPSPLQYGNILLAMRRHATLCYVVIDGHITCLRDEAPPLSSFYVA